MKSRISLILPVFCVLFSSPGSSANLVDVEPRIPDAIFDIRYNSSFNFVGAPIDGYLASKCLLTPAAADALQAVQKKAKNSGMSLKIFDCYRPQQAVDHFVRWAKDLDDTRMKQVFYPRIAKSNLFSEGYIAEKSGHSRGSTIDLTLVRSDPDAGTISELDMGTNFDFFDPISHTDATAVSAVAKRNRQVLRQLMESGGFKNLPEEWWHFTLVNEPFPTTYFNSPVR